MKTTSADSARTWPYTWAAAAVILAAIYAHLWLVPLPGHNGDDWIWSLAWPPLRADTEQRAIRAASDGSPYSP